MEYHLRLSRPNGELFLDRFEHFKSDEHALAAARAMLAAPDERLRVEVWRGEKNIYGETASQRIYRRGNVVYLRFAPSQHDHEPPQAA